MERRTSNAESTIARLQNESERDTRSLLILKSEVEQLETATERVVKVIRAMSERHGIE